MLTILCWIGRGGDADGDSKGSAEKTGGDGGDCGFDCVSGESDGEFHDRVGDDC